MTVQPDVRSIVLPKMIDLNKLLFLECILVPYSHFAKMRKKILVSMQKFPFIYVVPWPAPSFQGLAHPSRAKGMLKPETAACPFAVKTNQSRRGGKGGGKAISVESQTPDSSPRFLWLS